MPNECDKDGLNEEDRGDGMEIVEIEVEDGIDVDGEVGAGDDDTGLQVESGWSSRDRVFSKYSQEVSTVDYQSSTEPCATERNDRNESVENQQPPENRQQLGDKSVLGNCVLSVPVHPVTVLPPSPSRCYDPKTGEIVLYDAAYRHRVRHLFTFRQFHDKLH